MNTFSYIVHKLHSSSDEQYHFDLTNLSINNRSAYMALDISNTMKRFGHPFSCNLIQNMIFQLRGNRREISPGGLNKFEHFKMIEHLSFISDDVKKHVRMMHILSQRHYSALCKFAYTFKLKRAPIIMQTDLYLNDLNQKQRNVITIFQHNCRYLFSITDLNKIVESSVCNSPYFISEPLPVKNPYNNLPFSKSDLYNIYFQIKDRLIRTPEVLYKFFLSNFNLTDFQRNNQVLIRNKYINQFVENEDESTLVDYILNMLTYDARIKIDPDFPDNTLVLIFKPYLRLYLEMNYSFDCTIRHRAKCLLINKLNVFHLHNPQFGRRIFKIKNKRVIGAMTYNTDYIEFSKRSPIQPPFLETHTIFNEDFHHVHDVHIQDVSDDDDDTEPEPEPEPDSDDEPDPDHEPEPIELNNQVEVEEYNDISDQEMSLADGTEFRDLVANVYGDNIQHFNDPFIHGNDTIDYFDIDTDFDEEDEEMYDP